ncbi:MAG: Hsp20/alpha crystallin family protein [Planctomycetota bacterium]
MSIQLQASGSNFDRLADEVWSMMSEVMGKNFFRSHESATWEPSVNLYETAKQYIVCVELAGMTQKEIGIFVDGGLLHVSGSRPKPHVPAPAKSIGVLLMEIDSGRFLRTLPLPKDVLVDQIKASYQRGFLWVLLPRGDDPSLAEDQV